VSALPAETGQTEEIDGIPVKMCNGLGDKATEGLVKIF